MQLKSTTYILHLRHKMRFRKQVLVRCLLVLLTIGGTSLIIQIRHTFGQVNQLWVQSKDLKRRPIEVLSSTNSTRDISSALFSNISKNNPGNDADTFIFMKGDENKNIRQQKGIRALSAAEELKQKWKIAIELQAEEKRIKNESLSEISDNENLGTVNASYHLQSKEEDSSMDQFDGSIQLKPPMSGILNYTKWISRDDPHEYPYILNPESICSDDENSFKRLTLLIMVISEPRNYNKRRIIRKTWAAQSAHFASSVTTTVFLLGRGPAQEMTQFNLGKEAEKYGDIIQEDFLDSYLNLTIKTVMGLKWATKFCPRSKFVLKIDDDVSLNIDRLLAFLRRSPLQNFYGGKAAIKFPVLRDPKEKFYVPWSIFSEDIYPPYCVGIGYVMSTDLVYKLYFRSLTTPLFPWEDVFMGMLLRHYAISPTDIPNFFTTSWSFFHSNGTMILTNHNISKLRASFTLHGLTPYQNAQVWSIWSGKSIGLKEIGAKI